MLSGGMSGGSFGGGGRGWGGSFHGGLGPGAMRRMGEMGLDQGDGSLYDHGVVMRLLKYFRPYMAIVVIAFIATLAYTGTVVALPLIVRWVIDDYIKVGDLSGLNLAVGLFIAVAAGQFVTSYLNMRLMALAGQNVLRTLRVDLFSHIQRLSMSFFDKNEVGRVMSRVQNDVRQLQEVLSIFVNSLGQVLSLVGVIWAMMFLDFQLALITLSVVPILFVVLNVWQRFARRSFMRVRTAIADVNSGLQENISGVRVVQSLNREQTNIRRFQASNVENLEANLQASRLTAALFPFVEILTSLGLALVVFFGGSMVLDGTLDVGVLVAFALYIQRFFEPVRTLTQDYGGLQRAMVSGSRIFEILDMEPEVQERTDAKDLPPVKGEICFENVGFHYEEDEPVLEDIDLHMRAGETVALVGPTGAGKTTMLSLLLRLYDVKEGRITIDGSDIRDISLDSLYSQVSVVPQEPYLFSGSTIRENVRYNREYITDEQIESAAKAVGAHDFITAFENGYDTPLQERGGNLSIGQRQLISFARAIVGEPHILILDEATANIDTNSEMKIQCALAELLKGRTAVVIAHRLSTIRNSDLIVALDRGRVVEQGTHDELTALNGLYSRLQSYSGTGNGGDGSDAGERSPGGQGGWNGPGRGASQGFGEGRGRRRPEGEPPMTGERRRSER